MRLILIPYHYRYDYIINCIAQTKLHTLVGIVAEPVYCGALLKDMRCLQAGVEVVDALDKITGPYDGILYIDTALEPEAKKRWDAWVLCSGKKIIRIAEKAHEQREVSVTAAPLAVPVITLAKTNRKLKSMKFLSALERKLSEAGNRTLVISGDAFAELFGYELFPEEFFAEKILEKKVELLNRFVCGLIENIRPEVVLVDIPGDISQEYVAVIQRAVGGDYNLVLSEAFRWYPSYYSLLERSVKEHYYGTVHEIVMADEALEFLGEEQEVGLPISKEALKTLSGPVPTVFDVDEIDGRIQMYFDYPDCIS